MGTLIAGVQTKYKISSDSSWEWIWRVVGIRRRQPTTKQMRIWSMKMSICCNRQMRFVPLWFVIHMLNLPFTGRTCATQYRWEFYWKIEFFLLPTRLSTSIDSLCCVNSIIRNFIYRRMIVNRQHFFSDRSEWDAHCGRSEWSTVKHITYHAEEVNK